VTGIRAWTLLIFLPAAWVLMGCGDEGGSTTGKVTINGFTWVVDLAMTEQQRYDGLSGRQYLLEGTGMLFLYGEQQPLEFCMRGCVIPLDIAYLSSDFRVVSMHTMEVEPDRVGLKGYPSGVPARYALEVPAGELARADVRIGSRATFSDGIPDAIKADP
jgi:uncharacterized protein